MDYSRRDFVRTLFVASQATLLSRFVPANAQAAEADKGALHFVVIGDWGRLGRPDQHQVAEQMAATAKDNGASFVISVGDNFYEDGVLSADDPLWLQSFENVYSAPSLQVPWYSILGNHDYHGNPQAELDYALKHPRWVMPARYYTRVQSLSPTSNLELFFIDTSPMIKSYREGEKVENENMRKNVLTQDVPAQLTWLENALAQSKADWKIVVGHHPIYSGGKHGDQPELIAQILPLLQKYKVPAYFCGHDHDLQHLQAGDVNLFVSGAGSENRPNHDIPQSKYRSEKCSGFMAFAIAGKEMKVRVIDNLGNQIYSTSVVQMA